MSKRRRDTLCFAARRLGKATDKLIDELKKVVTEIVEKILRI